MVNNGNNMMDIRCSSILLFVSNLATSKLKLQIQVLQHVLGLSIKTLGLSIKTLRKMFQVTVVYLTSDFSIVNI